MTTRVRWFGLITLLIVFLVVPVPAWARVVHTDNGNGAFDAGEQPAAGTVPFPWTYGVLGDAALNVNITPLTGPADANWTANAICLTTQPVALAIPPFIGHYASAASPVFHLSRVVPPITLAPFTIKVTFKIRFSTNQFVFPPSDPVGVLRQVDHFEAILMTAAGDYNLVRIDTNGPQASKYLSAQTTISGWPGTWGAGDLVNASPYANGTGTLTVVSTFLLLPGDQAKIALNDEARLRLNIFRDGIGFFLPSAACIQGIKVEAS